MASPLQYFRKHQGYILAVLGVILILTWVIGPSLESLFEATPGGQAPKQGGDEVVARHKNGAITRSDLNRMQWEHQAVVGFLVAVIQRAQAEGATPEAPFLNIQQDRIADLGIETSSSDQALVQIELLAKKGKELGVSVDQKAVQEYLNNLGGYILTESDLYQIAHETLSQRRDAETRMQLVTVAQLFDRLKVELVARQAQEMYLTGIAGFSTGELWEYHERLHRRYKIEAYPLEVAAYKDQIKAGDAKEEELKKIYQEGRERVPNPDLHEPGFRRPLRLAFGYVKADSQTFLDAAKKDISEEQIVAEYEKEIGAGNFRKLNLDSPTSPGTVIPPEGADKPAGETEPTAPAADAESSDKKKDGDKPAEPAASEKAKSPAEDSKPAIEKSPAEKAVDESPAEEKESCQDEPSNEATQQPADDAKADSKEDPATKDDKPVEVKPAEVKPAAAGSTDKAPEATSESKPAEPEFKPLSEVREEILRKLALPGATAASEAALTAVNRAVQDYGVKHTRWIESTKVGRKTSVKNPGELRIKALAQKHGLTVGETPLMDQFQVAATDLGSQAAVMSPRGGAVPFPEGAYGEDRPLYAPQQAFSRVDEAAFVYWRTAEEPSVIVPYEKARQQVVEAWIKQQAVEMASQEAQALAAKAAKAPSLKEALPEGQAKKVLEPLPFSWLSRSGQPIAFGGAPRLSEVSGIPLAGQEFMQSVFDLNVGEAGIAINQAHTTVCVVRVVAEEPALDIRREMFLSSLQAGLFGDLVQYGLMARRSVMFDVMDELRKEYQLEWVGSPRMDGEMEM